MGYRGVEEQECSTYGGDLTPRGGDGYYCPVHKLIDYIEYWKCNEYAFKNENALTLLNSISSVNTIRQNGQANICSTNSNNGINNQFESWSYIASSHSTGYRNKDDNRDLPSWITDANNEVLTKNFISSNWINALSTSLLTEIRARLANYLYSNETSSVNPLINDLIPQSVVDGNVVSKLRDAMNLLSTGVSRDNGADLQEYQSVIPNSKNISTTARDIVKSEVKQFINDCNFAIKDCICYSDCGEYAVCFCYGNCNYY